MQTVSFRKAYEVESVTPWPPVHVLELRTGTAWAIDALGLPEPYESIPALLAAHPVVLRPSCFVEALWTDSDRAFRLVRPIESTRGRLLAGTAVRRVRAYPIAPDSSIEFAVRDGGDWHEAMTRDRMILDYLRRPR